MQKNQATFVKMDDAVSGIITSLTRDIRFVLAMTTSGVSVLDVLVYIDFKIVRGTG